jgi:alpha-L-rhamnosidase
MISRRLLPALLLCAALAPAALAAVTPTHLRCEYKVEPLAIDTDRPRLFWTLESRAKNQRQSAYRILVASTPQLLAKDTGDLWDSGKVVSDESIQRVYGGKSLAPSQKAHWKVCAWDERGAARWSRPATWTRGIAAQDWTARWIQTPPPAGKAAPPSLKDAAWIWRYDGETPPAGRRWFRTPFTADAGTTVTLALAADDSYTVFLNGEAVPGATGTGWQNPFVHDLTALARPGTNTLEIAVDNASPGPGGLIAKLVVGDRPIRTGIDWTVSADRTTWERVNVLGTYGIGPWGAIQDAGNNALTAPPHFAGTISLRARPTRALLYATALGVYELALNGKAVGDDVLSPGWTDYAKRVHYLAYDVTKALHPGENRLEAQLGDGWYASFLAFTGRRRYYGGDPKLRLQLRVDYADGSHETFGTDAHWRWASGPITSADMLMGVTVDTRRGLSAWKPVQVAADPGIAVEAHPGEPIRPAATLPARTRTEPKKGVFVYDLGQNLTGWARLTVTGTPGQTVTIRHAERLSPDGTAYFANLRAARATDTFVLKGGRQTLEPKFTFHGFQYVEITGASTPPAPRDVVGVAVHSAMDRTLTFDSDNPLLNKLADNIDWGFRGNALDVPTDCPQRDERAGWTGDAQVFAKTAMLNRDTPAFFTKWLVDLIEDGQGSEGALPDVAPYLTMVGRGNAAWEDAGVVVVARMYEMYGDTRAITTHWERLTRYMEHLAKVAPDGIRDPGAYGDWLLLDAPQRSAVHGTAYYFQCARLMAQLADAIGKTDDAARYRALAQKVRAAFGARFVSPDGRVSDDGAESQTFYALALDWHLIDDTLRPQAQKRLERLLRLRGNRLATGFIGTPVLLFALDSVGRADLANTLVLNEDYPSWLYQVRLGSTTMWERWDGWTPTKGFQDPGMNSFNHYWLGCVSEWMTTRLVGIDTDGPGWKQVTIRPRIDGALRRASARYDSIRGPIQAGWTKNADGTVTVTATIPANVTASIFLPGVAAPKAVGSGTHVFTVPVVARP